jgi:Dyp-type peroxidase family
VKNTPSTQLLDLSDIQGLILRGYGKLTSAAYLLLRIPDIQGAKNYINWLLDEKLISPGTKDDVSRNQKNDTERSQAMHIAFTNHGLNKLVSCEITNTFSPEFRQGMDFKYRSPLLGDGHENQPDNWKWGNKKHPVDMIILCFAKDKDSLNDMLSKQRILFQQYSIHRLATLDTYETMMSKNGDFFEHFGFRDGISTPRLTGLPDQKHNDPTLTKAGEFVLGYENEYGSYTPSPEASPMVDPKCLLPPSFITSGYKDLGKNGSYLVFRQLEQDVYAFWKYLIDNSRETGSTKEEQAIHLGAKMVGRWPGGAPIAINNFDFSEHGKFDEFIYSSQDAKGYGCPYGAHIRRTNPRDMLHSGREPEQSSEITKKHQIIRRGRIYGKPLVESMKPVDMLKMLKNDNVERGLHFICLAADIGKQFEFIQTVWANNFTFAGRCNEVDPLISPRSPKAPYQCVEFTVNGAPLRRNYDNIPQFTTMKGGAYFFLPGLRALRFIANV